MPRDRSVNLDDELDLIIADCLLQCAASFREAA